MENDPRFIEIKEKIAGKFEIYVNNSGNLVLRKDEHWLMYPVPETKEGQDLLFKDLKATIKFLLTKK